MDRTEQERIGEHDREEAEAPLSVEPANDDPSVRECGAGRNQYRDERERHVGHGQRRAAGGPDRRVGAHCRRPGASLGTPQTRTALRVRIRRIDAAASRPDRRDMQEVRPTSQPRDRPMTAEDFSPRNRANIRARPPAQCATRPPVISNNYRPVGQVKCQPRAQLIVVLRDLIPFLYGTLPPIPDNYRKLPLFLGQLRQRIP